MKKIIKLIIPLLSCLWFGMSVFAAELNNGSVDVILVLDRSKSMEDTDPGRLSLEGAKLFIDMMEATGSGAGVVAFSDVLEPVVEVAALDSQEDKGRIKDAIDQITYGSYTDMGLAMREGYRLLEQSNSSNKKAILLFTDGVIDLSKNSDRTEMDSQRDVMGSVTDLGLNEIPVYTIGLNADGSVDAGLLEDIAKQTGGKTYIVGEAGELPDIFNEIFADFVSSKIQNLGEYRMDGVNETEIPLFIPNSGVIEANIIMLSDSPVTDVKMEDPDHNTLLVDDSRLFMSNSKKYSMLKLLEPAAGDWILRIMSDDACVVHVNLILNSDLALVSTAELRENENGSVEIVAQGRLQRGGKDVDTQEIYRLFTGNLTVTDPDNYAEVYDAELKDCVYECIIPVTKSGEYRLRMGLDGENLYRESEVMTVVAELPEAVIQETEMVDEETFVSNPESPEENEKETKSGVPTAIMICICVFSALLVIVLLYFLFKVQKKKKAKWYGTLSWTVQKKGRTVQSSKKSMGYEKGSVVLEKLIPGTGLELSAIVMSMDATTNAGIFVKNKSNKCLLQTGFGGTETTNARLGKGQSFLVSDKSGKTDTIVRVTYIL